MARAHLLNMQPQYETARRHKSMRGFCQERAINANIVNGGAAAEKVSIYIYWTLCTSKSKRRSANIISFYKLKTKRSAWCHQGWSKQCCAAVYFTKIQIWSFFLFLIFVNQNYFRFRGINCLLLLARVRETFKNKSKSLFILCDGEIFASCVFQLLALAHWNNTNFPINVPY